MTTTPVTLINVMKVEGRIRDGRSTAVLGLPNAQVGRVVSDLPFPSESFEPLRGSVQRGRVLNGGVNGCQLSLRPGEKPPCVA